MRLDRATRRVRRQRESNVYRNGTAASLLMLLAGAYPPRAYAQAAESSDFASVPGERGAVDRLAAKHALDERPMRARRNQR